MAQTESAFSGRHDFLESLAAWVEEVPGGYKKVPRGESADDIDCLWNCDNHASAGFCPPPPVTMLHCRIEVNRVFGLELEFLAADLQG